MRRVIRFASKGHGLVGTLDEAPGRVGVLIVSGGNEPRMGAHRGMALLAARLAAQGTPVFRFDRSGVGDSEGENGGYAESLPDIFNAALLFGNEVPTMRAILGFGNCDAAAALAIFGRGTGVDAVLLANPWLGTEGDALPPTAAIRARYAERLRSPAAWRRLLTGGVDLRRLAAGLRKVAAPPPVPPTADRVLAGIADWGEDAQVLLASGDATAIAFRDRTARRPIAIDTIDTASHSFAGHAAQTALTEALVRGVKRLEQRLA